MQNHTLINKIKSQNIVYDVIRDDQTVISQLLPVNYKIINDDFLINQLTKWRNESMRFFKSQFKSTSEGTKTWLTEKIVPANDRILFLVSSKGKVVGHFGLCNITDISAELDNAIRGEIGGPSDLFAFVEKTLLNISFTELNVEQVVAKVFSNNIFALQLHKNLGFQEKNRVPLKLIISENKKVYEECLRKDANVNFDYAELVISKSDYMEIHK
ncbi:MAG: GNAT family protein [Bacteroidota bacterium]|nr:GNAT family protein [Bacteroidota bacterium]